MSEWGRQTYGEPCRECGFSWSVEVESARDLVRKLPSRAAALLARGRSQARDPDLAWTSGGYACHLSDNLRIWAERLAAAAAGVATIIAPYGADLLATARRYNDLPVEGVLWSLEQAVDEWLNATALAAESDVVLGHPERGALVVVDVVRNNAHDVVHHEWDMRRSIPSAAGPGDRINYVPIDLSPFDTSWAEEFDRYAADLRSALGTKLVRIEHIGSTSVPGLDAKPTIDIAVAVGDVNDLGAYLEPLERLGFTLHERSLGDPEHRFFSAPARAAHIHVCNADGRWERVHLLFRDFLRSDPDVAKRYSEMKRNLATANRDDRIVYNDAKTHFIEDALVAAERWAGP
jgi:GrpB-like predicted nucleotidyltransferase (UPF0157 family)